MAVEYYEVTYVEDGDERVQPVAANSVGHAREQFEDEYGHEILDVSFSHSV